MDVRTLIRKAQEAELQGDRARARELLGQAASHYESEGQTGRAEQLRRHAERLAAVASPAPAPTPAVTSTAAGSAETPTGGAQADGVELPQRGPVLAPADLEAWCSFCCRPRDEVGPLVQAPVDAFICAGCLADSSRLLGSEPSVRALGWVAQKKRQMEAAAAVSASDAQPANVRDLASVRAKGLNALPSLAKELSALEARLSSGGVRALLLGPVGSGKSTWLQSWAERGLGERVSARDLLEGEVRRGSRVILVDDVDRLDPDEALALAHVLPASFVLAARGTRFERREDLALPFTTELLRNATAGRVAVEVLEQVEGLYALPPLVREDFEALASAVAAKLRASLRSEQLSAIAQAASTSERGGHEVAALVRRAAEGSSRQP